MLAANIVYNRTLNPYEITIPSYSVVPADDVRTIQRHHIYYGVECGESFRLPTRYTQERL